MKKHFLTKTLALSILFCSANLLTNAQAPNIQWQKTIGGSADDYNEFGKITQLKDGNYLMVGNTNSTDGCFYVNKGGLDAFAIKFKPSGKIVWAKTYGGSADEVFNGVVENADHTLLIAGGTFSNDGDVSGNHGDEDAWVVKLSANGTLLSQHCFGGSLEDFASDMVLIGNHYAFNGWSFSNDGDVSGNHGDNDAWVVKLNQSGNIIWSKTFGGTGPEMSGGIIAASNSNIIISGFTNSGDGDMVGYHGDVDAYAISINSSGNINWSRCYGGSGADYSAFGNGVAKDGNLLIPGSTNSNDGDVTGNHGGYDTWVTKINNATGAVIWSKCFGTALYEYGYGIMTMPNGDLVSLGITGPDDEIFGDSYTDAQAIRLDKNGNQIWSKSFGGSDWDDAEDGVPTADGGMLFLCHTSSTDGDVTNQHGSTDMWLVKLDGNGCHHHRDAIDIASANFSIATFPNPFSTSTLISFSLPESQNVLLQIFDVNGKLVSMLADKNFEEGEHQIEFNAEKINAGIYFLKMQVGDFLKTEKLIITK